MTVPRLESGENLFEVLREKFNALADAVEQLDKLASASPLLDILDTGAGKLIRWNGPDPENAGTPAPGTTAASGYAGAFAVELVGGTSAHIFNGANPAGEYAGEIRIGNTSHNMPAGTVAVTPGQAAEIYLTVYYDATATPPALVYGFANTLSASVTGVQGWYRTLAHVSSGGTVTQAHLGGDIEICGRWI
ncbi:MAG: hypothetical protein J6Y92_01275 [Lentisphaeria bacterium]|nr:hypothetical protein [Lentisphaeria bacterium]